MPQTVKGFNSATIGHIGVIFGNFIWKIAYVKAIRDIYDIRTLSWSNIVKNMQWMEILDI